MASVFSTVPTLQILLIWHDLEVGGLSFFSCLKLGALIPNYLPNTATDPDLPILNTPTPDTD